MIVRCAKSKFRDTNFKASRPSREREVEGVGRERLRERDRETERERGKERAREGVRERESQ